MNKLGLIALVVSLVTGCTNRDTSGDSADDGQFTQDDPVQGVSSDPDNDTDAPDDDTDAGTDAPDDDTDVPDDGTDTSAETTTWWYDADGDSYGDPAEWLDVADGNAPPVGYVDNSDDCDDTHDGTAPDRVEWLNGLDENCNGLVDEGCGTADVQNQICTGEDLVVLIHYFENEACITDEKAIGLQIGYMTEIDQTHWVTGGSNATVVSPVVLDANGCFGFDGDLLKVNGAGGTLWGNYLVGGCNGGNLHTYSNGAGGILSTCSMMRVYVNGDQIFPSGNDLVYIKP